MQTFCAVGIPHAFLSDLAKVVGPQRYLTQGGPPVTVRNFDHDPARRRLQPEVGTSDHWGLFLAFQGTPVQEMLEQRAQQYLDEQTIDSGIAGREVLTTLTTEERALLAPVEEQDRGGLFGMVLWNLLCRHDVDWLFIDQTSHASGFSHKNYWRGR